MDRYIKGCNTLNGLSNKVCIRNKTVNIMVSNMIKETNEWKTLTKNIPCEYKYKFDHITVGASVKIKNIVCLKKIIFGIQLHVIVKIVNL